MLDSQASSFSHASEIKRRGLINDLVLQRILSQKQKEQTGYLYNSSTSVTIEIDKEISDRLCIEDSTTSQEEIQNKSKSEDTFEADYSKYLAWNDEESETYEFDVDAPLIPPSKELQTIQVNVIPIGRLKPRIIFDPEFD